VPLQGTCRWARAGWTARIKKRTAAGIQNRLKLLLDEPPCAHISRFFLAPHHIRGSWVTRDHRSELVFRKWINLFQARDRDMLRFSFIAGGQQVIVDLSGANDDSSDLRRIRAGVVYDLAECAAGKLIQHGHSLGMPQHALGRKNDQRLADAAPVMTAVHLPPQHVKVLRRSAEIHNLDVIVGAQLQEALNTRAGMLRTLSFVAVRRSEERAAGLAPLRLCADDELVNHDLRAVGEVAKL